jgi:tetratricopeptide (TPR) repeat protein
MCPQCGTVYKGKSFDEAWKNPVHGSIAVNLERAAILAHLYPEDHRYPDYVRRTFLYYADHYLSYEVYGEHAGRGRIFPQCLAESLFVMDMEFILRMAGDLHLFTEEELLRIKEGFFRPAGELLLAQISVIHNIHVWMNGAVAAAAHVLQDRQWLELALDGPFGLLQQMEKGITEEGFWYEISPTYHFYTLTALMGAAWIARANGRDLFGNSLLAKMLQVPLELVYDNGELPAYNDSWYGRTLYQYAGIYEQAGNIYPEMAAALPRIYNGCHTGSYGHMTALGYLMPTPDSGYARHSTAALLFGPAELPEHRDIDYPSRVFPSTGIGILENRRMRAGLKFTRSCGGHEHFDKLSLDLFAGGVPVSPDLGTSGYGIAMTQLWHKAPASHNTVIVNGMRQNACGAELLHWGGDSIRACTKEAYPGVLLMRSLELADWGLTDHFTVECPEEAVLDWVFHCQGRLIGVVCEGNAQELDPAVPFEQGNGYDQIKELHTVRLDESWSISWQTPAGVLTLQVEAEKGTQVFTGRGFGPSGWDLGMLIIRRSAVKSVYRCRFLLP